MNEKPTDEELVDRACAAPRDDVRPFEMLVRRHRNHVMTNCRYLTRDADAEDLSQEVFVKAYFALERFEGRASFKTWLNRIKLNHCLNHLARERRRVAVPLEEDPHGKSDPRLHVRPKAEAAVQARQQRELIELALDSLPDSLRVPVVLREIDALSYQEIADQLEIGLSAAKMRIKRGREAFRQRYEELEGTGSLVGAREA